MTKLNSLLVIIDPTQDHQPALERAIQIADPETTSITLLMCVYNSSVMLDHLFNDKTREIAKQGYFKQKTKWLNRLMQDKGISYPKLEIVCHWHKPLYEGLIQKANEIKPDLVLKSTHKHPKFEHFFFSSTDWQLLKGMPFPLLMVKHGEKPAGQPVLAAIDPEHELSKQHQLDDAIIREANKIAEHLDSQVTYCHCFDTAPFEMFTAGSHVGAPMELSAPGLDVTGKDLLEQLKVQNKDKVEAYLKDQQLENADYEIYYGDPVDELINATSGKKASALVLGTTYRTGLLGSTAEQVLDKVECDVLAVKFDGFESHLVD